MEGEPEAGARPSGASAGGDPRFVDVPFSRLAADKLEGACGVVEGSLDGGDDVLSLGNVTIVDCDDGDAGFQIRFDGGSGLVSRLPTSAVDVEEEGRWLVGFRLPEIEDVPFVWSVREVFDGWRYGILAGRFGHGFGGFVGLAGCRRRRGVLRMSAESDASGE